MPAFADVDHLLEEGQPQTRQEAKLTAPFAGMRRDDEYDWPTLLKKPTILFKWADYCPPCKAELKELKEFVTSNKDVQLVFYAVDGLEKQNEIAQWLSANGLTNYPVVLGTQTPGWASLLPTPKDPVTQREIDSVPLTLFVNEGGLKAFIKGKASPQSIQSGLSYIQPTSSTPVAQTPVSPAPSTETEVDELLGPPEVASTVPGPVTTAPSTVGSTSETVTDLQLGRSYPEGYVQPGRLYRFNGSSKVWRKRANDSGYDEVSEASFSGANPISVDTGIVSDGSVIDDGSGCRDGSCGPPSGTIISGLAPSSCTSGNCGFPSGMIMSSNCGSGGCGQPPMRMMPQMGCGPMGCPPPRRWGGGGWRRR